MCWEDAARLCILRSGDVLYCCLLFRSCPPAMPQAISFSSCSPSLCLTVLNGLYSLACCLGSDPCCLKFQICKAGHAYWVVEPGRRGLPVVGLLFQQRALLFQNKMLAMSMSCQKTTADLPSLPPLVRPIKNSLCYRCLLRRWPKEHHVSFSATMFLYSFVLGKAGAVLQEQRCRSSWPPQGDSRNMAGSRQVLRIAGYSQ